MLKHFLKTRFLNITAKNRRLLFRKYASKPVNLEEPDRPLKFSTSPASRFKAGLSTRSEITPRLWYEPYVIIASITCFLLYFTYLREENDLDDALRTPLYERFEGLEKIELENFLKHADKSEDINQVKERLKELDRTTMKK